jgi:hypothetical protein
MKWLSTDAGSGDPEEKAFDTILASLKAHPDFVKPADELSVIIMTDEDEQSIVDAPTFTRELKALLPNQKISISTITAASDVAGCSSGDWDFARSKYAKVITEFSGKNYSLCSESSLPQDITNLGSEIATRAGAGPAHDKVLHLSLKPVLGSITVSYKGTNLPEGVQGTGRWIYDSGRQSVFLTDTSFLSSNATTHQIEVKYSVAH